LREEPEVVSQVNFAADHQRGVVLYTLDQVERIVL
jgi:hypothetical protein